MQLIPVTTKKRYTPSTESLKQPLPNIERFEYKPETTVILRRRFSAPVSISESYKEEKLTETSVTLQPQRLLKELENFYTFSNQKEIKFFLSANYELMEILLEAYKHIKRIFGENIVDIVLEYERDPEEDFEGLSAIVKTNLSPELSLNLLEKFDEEWWLDLDDEIRTILSVMVRPV